MKKKTILLTAAVLCAAQCTAQKVAYSYDSGGNRTLKKVVIIQTAAKGTDATFAGDEDTAAGMEAAEVTDEGITLRVSGSTVEVHIADALWQGEATLAVHDGGGRQAAAMRTASQDTQADLSGQPAGMYIITVKTGRRTKSWRMVIR